MGRKLIGYSVLSFFSFCFFIFIFLTFANANTKPGNTFQTAKPKVLPPIPTPTSIPTAIPIPTITLTDAPIPKSTAEPTPWPTKPKATATPTPISTPTANPTITPTPIPVSEPTATPASLPTLAFAPDLEGLFQKYSTEYAVAKDLLKRIAACESGFNSQADTGLYAGMFQFSSTTWINARNSMGLDPNPDLRKNPEESIRTAAFMIGRGQQNAWKNCL